MSTKEQLEETRRSVHLQLSTMRAEWYIGWSGKSGSAYHRRIAIPTLMRLLEIEPDQMVLDVGCGPGALAEHVVREGACYVGIDSSFAMIRAARRHHRHPNAQFVHGNASKLSTALKHTTHQFDAAVCLLSIQDMDPVDTMEEIPVDQDVFGRKADKRTTVLSTEIPLFLCIRAVKS